jgi:hypothetical protein
MQRSANEVMHDIIYAAVVDAIVALRGASGGLPNNLVREIGAIHVNSTFADLPKEVQAAITGSTRSAFTRLLKEGYSVANPAAAPSRPPPARGELVARDATARTPRRAPPAGAPGGNRPDNRGPRSGPGGKPRGPRPPRPR